MKYIEYDDDEKQIIEDIENDQFVAMDIPEAERKRLAEIAKATLEKNKNINIRISAKVLHKLKAMAIEEGLPYQTLVSSVLHKYVTGKIK